MSRRMGVYNVTHDCGVVMRGIANLCIRAFNGEDIPALPDPVKELFK